MARKLKDFGNDDDDEEEEDIFPFPAFARASSRKCGWGNNSLESPKLRTLDAIHLATAIVARNLVSEIQLNTLDERLRICGAQLGFEILPH